MGKFLLFLASLFAAISCKPSKSVASTNASSEILEIQKYHEAVRSYFKQDYSGALESSNELLKLNPVHDAALYLMSKIYFDQENWPESSYYLLKAAEADPNNQFIVNEIGYMYSATGNYAKAGKTYEALIKESPYEPKNYFGSYENYLKADDYKSSLRVLTLQEKHLGVSIELYLKKHRAYQLQRQPEKACAELEKGLLEFSYEPRLLAPLIDFYLENKNTEKAMSLLKQLCSADPENGYARYLYGNFLIKNGQTQEGQRLRTESTLLKGLPVEQKAEILLNHNKLLGCVEESRSMTLAFLNQNPNEFVAHTLAGDLMLSCQDPFSALTHYTRALNINPNAYPVWNPVLMICFREEIWDSLLVNSSRCIETFPLQPLPYLMLGIAQLQINRTEDARASFAIGKDYILDNSELGAQFSAYEALVMASNRNFSIAKSTLAELFQKTPKNYALKAEIAGQLLSYKELVTFADSIISECIEHDPNQGYFMMLKAKKCLCVKDYSLAQEWIEKAVTNGYPERFGIAFQGDIAHAKGDQSLAINLWKTAANKGNHSYYLRNKTP